VSNKVVLGTDVELVITINRVYDSLILMGIVWGFGSKISYKSK